jgi:hypothetical protein
MIDNFILFTKEDSNISSLWLYFVGALIVILTLKSLLKSTKIKPKVFDYIILFAAILFLILTFSNVIITQNYKRLWNILFVFVVIILQRLLPKFVKWYDGKIDAFCNKT